MCVMWPVIYADVDTGLGPRLVRVGLSSMREFFRSDTRERYFATLSKTHLALVRAGRNDCNIIF